MLFKSCGLAVSSSFPVWAQHDPFMLPMQAPALRLARYLSTPLTSRMRLAQVWAPSVIVVQSTCMSLHAAWVGQVLLRREVTDKTYVVS